MVNQKNKKTIVISEKEVQRKGGLVILSLKEYQKLRGEAVPTYYLEGKEAEELDELVKEGLEEYRTGKTIRAPSLKEALKE